MEAQNVNSKIIKFWVLMVMLICSFISILTLVKVAANRLGWGSSLWVVLGKLIFKIYIYIYIIYFNWRLITLQYCGGFCHTLTWISHRCTCVPHPKPHPTPLSIPSLWVVPVLQLWVPCFMHQTWTGHLVHIWYTCFNAILSNHPTLTFSHRVQKSVCYICVSFAALHIGLPLLLTLCRSPPTHPRGLCEALGSQKCLPRGASGFSTHNQVFWASIPSGSMKKQTFFLTHFCLTLFP